MSKEKIRFRAGGRPAVGGKGELTDAGTRVALIANWPGVIEGPAVVDDLVDFSDFLPTFIDLAGGRKRPGLDGISFAARLRGEGRGTRKWAFTEYRGRRWIRNRHWKLYGDGRLHDMSDGRGEEEPALLGAGGAEARHARDELTAAFRELGR